MPSQARIGDIGIGTCACHPPIPSIPMTGILITGSNDTLDNSISACRLTDIVLGACGHVGIMITSSSTAIINNLGAVRIGDQFAGCFTGIIVTGSPDTEVGG